MSTIRIRGWHTKLSKMFSPEEMANDQLTLLPTGEFINVSGANTKLSTIFPISEFIPLLSTNLFDKNGQEIFKGDILRFESQPELKIVKETPGGWNPFIDEMETDGSWHYIVVGNIYENKELIKE